jgi:hypothetical protein
VRCARGLRPLVLDGSVGQRHGTGTVLQGVEEVARLGSNLVEDLCASR